MATSRIYSTHFDAKPVLSAEQIAQGFYVHTYPADPGGYLPIGGPSESGDYTHASFAATPEYWAIIAPYDIERGNSFGGKFDSIIKDVIQSDPIRKVDLAIMDQSASLRQDISNDLVPEKLQPTGGDPVAAYELAMSEDGGNTTAQMQMQTRTAAIVGAIILTAGAAAGATAETGATIVGEAAAETVGAAVTAAETGSAAVAAGESGELIAAAISGGGGGGTWAEIATTASELGAGAKTAYGYSKEAYGAYTLGKTVANAINPDNPTIPGQDIYPAPGTDFKTVGVAFSGGADNNRLYLSAFLLALSFAF